MYDGSEIVCIICGVYVGENLDDAKHVRIKCPYCTEKPPINKKDSPFKKTLGGMGRIFDSDDESY